MFLLATFGEGEPTDNARRFYEWITSKEVDKDAAQGLDYAVSCIACFVSADLA